MERKGKDGKGRKMGGRIGEGREKWEKVGPQSKNPGAGRGRSQSQCSKHAGGQSQLAIDRAMSALTTVVWLYLNFWLNSIRATSSATRLRAEKSWRLFCS